jgi:hypothetical protein
VGFIAADELLGKVLLFAQPVVLGQLVVKDQRLIINRSINGFEAIDR